MRTYNYMFLFYYSLYSMNKKIKEKSERQNCEECKPVGDYELHPIEFTKEMKKDYTILIPQMAPIHFELLEAAVETNYISTTERAALEKWRHDPENWSAKA